MPRQSRSRLWVLLVLLVLLAVMGPLSYLGWRQSVAPVAVTAAVPRALGRQTTFTVRAEAAHGQVSRLEVRLVQGGKSVTAFQRAGALGPRLEAPVTVEGPRLGLREGAATLEVWAHDDFWRPLPTVDRALLSQPVSIDLTPPRIEILGATRYLAQGGAGLVAFRVTEASGASVSAGPLTYPSFPLGPPARGARVALIALPWDFAPGTALAVTARDEAGNEAVRGIPSEVRARRFPHDTIEIKDALLQAKVPELLPQRRADQPLLEGFLVINRDLRRQAETEKRRLGAQTADHALWAGAFVQPRNTKVFSNFAETRTYRYQGKEIDTQVHVGFDLASTRQAPVPAANRGVVVFAAPLSIYGNTVIVDHGLGLQTLYAHLSHLEVKVGDAVDRGQVLGRTGTSGLAVGDHLHFEVLVHGTSVTPREWWDAKWIRDHIGQPLAEAGLPALGAEADEGRAAVPARAPGR
ncbi:MAG TPA: M23 family metallopeptidase [Vicinamibacteria bacterium]|nr:M23 family metallopeptidase [Vicinamibacteria bacterium]